MMNYKFWMRSEFNFQSNILGRENQKLKKIVDFSIFFFVDQKMVEKY